MICSSFDNCYIEYFATNYFAKLDYNILIEPNLLTAF